MDSFKCLHVYIYNFAISFARQSSPRMESSSEYDDNRLGRLVVSLEETLLSGAHLRSKNPFPSALSCLRMSLLARDEGEDAEVRYAYHPLRNDGIVIVWEDEDRII